MADALTVDDLRTAVSAFFTPESSLADTRAVAEGRRSGWDVDRWTAVSRDLGYGALLIPEHEGGLGLSMRHAVVAVEAVGAVVSSAPARSVLLAQAAVRWSSDDGGDRTTRDAVVETLVSRGVVAVVTDPAGAVEDAVGARWLLECDPAGRVVAVDAGSPEVSVEPCRGVDPGRSHARVRFSTADAGVVGRWLPGVGLSDIALLLRAAEQVGVARGATRHAARHAREREQFGAPIGAHQAISHRLAADVVATEKAAALVATAAQAVDDDAWERAARLIPVAASAAARASVAATRSLIQVLGGVGFTWEHDAQFWFRRALALSAAIATPEALDEMAVARGALALVGTGDGGS